MKAKKQTKKKTVVGYKFFDYATGEKKSSEARWDVPTKTKGEWPGEEDPDQERGEGALKKGGQRGVQV